MLPPDLQQSLFEAIATHPDNDALRDQLEQTVRNQFPEYFDLILTNATGNAGHEVTVWLAAEHEVDDREAEAAPPAC
jgi:hypothetical protein